jgi:acetyl esterase/lipase
MNLWKYSVIGWLGWTCSFLPVAAQKQEVLSIWEGSSVHAKVELTPYLLPEGEPHTAVIVCPGGSYHWLDKEVEGRQVAQWLNANGIAAFVLTYRTAGVPSFVTHYRYLFRGHRHPDMIQDLQRSIQLVRERCDEFHINPEQLGVMGFSAGGHLVASAGLYAHTNFLALKGIYPSVSLRPDFVAAVYPVVTFSDKRYVHKRSRRGLLGEWKRSNRKMQDSLSLEKHAAADCPPLFLTNCVDDPIVHYRNSELLDSALTAQKAPHVYFQYQKGGHGFGATERKEEDSNEWKTQFLHWLTNIF